MNDNNTKKDEATKEETMEGHMKKMEKNKMKKEEGRRRKKEEVRRRKKKKKEENEEKEGRRRRRSKGRYLKKEPSKKTKQHKNLQKQCAHRRTQTLPKRTHVWVVCNLIIVLFSMAGPETTIKIVFSEQHTRRTPPKTPNSTNSQQPATWPSQISWVFGGGGGGTMRGLETPIL